MALKLGKTAAFHFLTQVVVSLSGFIATFAVARLLGAGPLGVYAKAVAVLFLVAVPIIAVHTAVIKRMSEGEDRAEFFGAGLVIVGAIVVGLVVAALVARPYFEAYIGAPVTAEFILLLVGTGAFRLLQAVLSGEKRVARSGVIQSVERIVRTALQIGFILVGYAVSGLLLGHGLALVTAAVIGLALVDTRPRMPDRSHLQSLAAYSRFSWLARLKSRAFSWTDTAVLGFFVTSSLIGVYEVAWTLSAALILVSKSIQHTLFPELSDLGTHDDFERIHHFLNEGLVFTGVFCIPGLVGAALIGPRLLAIYDQEFRVGGSVLVILITAQLVAAYGEQFVSAINAIDHPEVAFRISGLFVVANVVLNVALVSVYGWEGAAVATAISAGGLSVAGFAALSRLVGRPSLPWAEFGAQVLASTVMGGVLYLTRFTVPMTWNWTLVLVFGAAAVYSGVLVTVSTRIRGKAVSLIRSVAG